MGLYLSKANTYSSSADGDQRLAEKIEEGVRYYRHGQYKEALACLDQAIAAYPNSEEAHMRKWYVFIEQGNTEEAKREREIVSKINPENLVVSCSLANAQYRKTGDTKSHEKAMDKILKAKAKNFHEYVLQGGIYADRGNVEMKIAKYREALEFKPDAIIYHDLGILLNHRGYHHAFKGNPQASEKDHQASKEAFLASIKLDGKCGSSWSGLGTVYYALGEYEAALEAHSKAVDLIPNDLLKLCNRADNYIVLNRREEANKDFALAQKLFQNPENLKSFSTEQIKGIKSLLELATIDLTAIKQKIDWATESEAFELYQKTEEIERHRDTLVSQAVSAVGSQNQDQDMMAATFRQMQKMQQKIDQLQYQFAAKADASAVSAAIWVNSAEEGDHYSTPKDKLGDQDAMKVITGITARINEGFIATPLVSEDSLIDQCLGVLGLTPVPEVN